MNSSTHRITNIIIDSTILTTSSISVCISTGMFGFILYHVIKTKKSPNRVALLLTANIYLALLFSSTMFVEQFVRVLPAHLYSFASLNDGIKCQIRGYFHWVAICGIFYSNILQAIYRLCRVVFYTKQRLQSFQFYQIMIIVQWIICFLIPIPTLLLGDFRYSANDYNCQNDTTNLRSAFMSGTLTYIVPLNITNGCYIYTLRKMRRGNNSFMQTMTQIQQISARRDLVVLFRVCILIGLLTIFFLPSVILLFNYIATGYIPWWAAPSQWFTLSLSTTIVIIILPLLSPHVQNLWSTNVQRHRHVAIALVGTKIN